MWVAYRVNPGLGSMTLLKVLSWFTDVLGDRALGGKTYPRPQKPAAYSLHLPGYGGAAATSVREVSGGDVAVSLRFECGRNGASVPRARFHTAPKTGNPETVLVSYFTHYEAKAVSGSVRCHLGYRQPRCRRRLRMPIGSGHVLKTAMNLPHGRAIC